jgi:DNA-nicking Smr family endonuclease
MLSEFIRYHISKKSGTIHIVHGKGEGILKKEVEALLHSFSEVSLVVPRMDKGSIDVWLGAVR